MGQNTGSIAQLLKYSFKVIPEMYQTSDNIREMQGLCLIKKESPQKPENKSELSFIPDVSRLSAGFFALHPCADIKNTSAFVLALNALADTLEAYRTKHNMTGEPEIRKLFSCLSGAIDPSRSTNCELKNINKETDNPAGDKRTIPCLCDYCRLQLAVLPSFPQVAQKLKKYMQFYIDFKSYSHYPLNIRSSYLEAWSCNYLKRYRDIHWWEFCAASDSLMGILAMYVSASDPGLTSMEVQSLDEACFPWLSGLDSLLRVYACARIQNSNYLNLSTFYKNLKDMEERILFFAGKAEEACKHLKFSNVYMNLIKLVMALYLALPEANFGMNSIAASNIRRNYLSGTGFQYNICKLIHYITKSEFAS